MPRSLDDWNRDMMAVRDRIESLEKQINETMAESKQLSDSLVRISARIRELDSSLLKLRRELSRATAQRERLFLERGIDE